MLFSLLPPATLFLSASFVTAKTTDFTLSLFPAIPEVTEIVAHSSLLAIVKETGAASTEYGINAKRPKATGTSTGTAAATPTDMDMDFYIDVTTYPNQKTQVLNYFTGDFIQVAEATCSFEGTTSAICQVTRLADPVAAATATALTDEDFVVSEVRFPEAQMTFQPIVFRGAPADSSARGAPADSGAREVPADSGASSLSILGVPALVASLAAATIMLL
ncbi:hypothetical protein TWF481_009418 [Arthrobotrys musiformis]|uniref:Uncharacterized protein n=1 Tax=Arthrobotrys musiformis TaxID=47236 RepID=A0AAV9W3Q1_9PEZI